VTSLSTVPRWGKTGGNVPVEVPAYPVVFVASMYDPNLTASRCDGQVLDVGWLSITMVPHRRPGAGRLGFPSHTRRGVLDRLGIRGVGHYAEVILTAGCKCAARPL